VKKCAFAGEKVCTLLDCLQLETEKEKRMRKSKEISTFITTLKKQPMILPEWNERLWITLLDMAIVQRDGSIVFRFKSGKEIIK